MKGSVNVPASPYWDGLFYLDHGFAGKHSLNDRLKSEQAKKVWQRLSKNNFDSCTLHNVKVDTSSLMTWLATEQPDLYSKIIAQGVDKKYGKILNSFTKGFSSDKPLDELIANSKTAMRYFDTVKAPPQVKERIRQAMQSKVLEKIGPTLN